MNKTTWNKTLSLVEANPYRSGVELVAMYRPAGGIIRDLEKAGLIQWASDGEREGWVVIDIDAAAEDAYIQRSLEAQERSRTNANDEVYGGL